MIKKNASKKSAQLPKDDGKPLRLVTPREACDYGRFGHTKLYDYINAELIDAYKRDKRTLIDLNSIDKMNSALPKVVANPKAISKKKRTAATTADA